MSATEPLLKIRGLGVSFDGFHALTDVDLDATEGEVHFLIGPNGAGKTTLVDIVTGLTKPTTGSVHFAGQELVGRKEHRSCTSASGARSRPPASSRR